MWDMKPTKSTTLLLALKSLRAIILFNMESMLMVPTNRFLVYTSENAGVFVKADEAVVHGDTVSFLFDKKVVRSFPKKDFFKYNEKFYALENIS